jgi:class 3 adenylate cyclase/tetratricopeptide (TPR) repeat protein
MANMQHRLAALWFADIVGFSQLSHEDESVALEVVQLFQGITRDTVGRYGGHVVKFVGDGALAEFHSTEAAIRAACRLRSSFSEQTKANDLGERDLHIGVHVGEIATTPDGDVYGDGVNATARIMNQAEPGQILASDDVWHQLRQRKEFQFEELGERDLRGAGQHVLHCVDVEDSSSTEWEVDENVFAGKLGTLYDELKRRRVFRVAVAYAVVAWLVTEIATTVIPALFLPAWIPRAVIVFAILGFPIAIVLAWAYDITSEGLKRTLPAGADADLRPRSFPLVQKLAAGLIIAAVVMGGWAAWNRWSLGPPSISASTVAILPFNVRAGETFQYLGEGMASLITTKMRGVEDYRSVDSHAVLKFVKSHGIRNIDRQSGQTVAERFGAGLYVLGDVVELGDQLHLNVSIYESGKQEPTAQISVQGDANNLTGLVDQIVGMMLAAQFGEAEAGLRPLAAMTTDSLEALKAYLKGESELHVGRFPEAAEAFQRAVAIDTLFALAYYKLGVAANWIPDFALAEEATGHALRHSHRLSPPDRILVEAFHALVNDQPTKVKDLLRPYLETHPDAVDALFVYGDALFHYNDLFGRPIAEAREYFERAVLVAPESNEIVGHLMDIAALEENFAHLDSLLTQVDADNEFKLKWRALLAFAVGDSAAQEEVIAELQNASDTELRLAVQRVASYSPRGHGTERVAQLLLEPQRPPGMQWRGRLWLMTMHLRGGRWDSAKREFAALQRFDPTTGLKLHAFYAAMPFWEVPDNELDTLHSQIERWDPVEASEDPRSGSIMPSSFDPLYRQYLLGLLGTRLGSAGGAITAAETLENWPGTSVESSIGIFLARHLRAHAALQRGNKEEALRILSETSALLPEMPASELWLSPFLWHAYERWVRAELLYEFNRLEEASKWHYSLAKGPSWLSLPFAPVSHRRLAEIHEQLGRTDQAIGHYERFIEFWQECAPTLRPAVTKARQQMEHLNSSRTTS